MKIVHIITRSDNIGGAQVHVRDLAVAARQAGHEVTVLVGGAGGEYTEDLTQHGVPWVELRRLGRVISLVDDPRAFTQIRRTLAELRPDLVATHSSKAGALGRVAAWSLDLPVVFTAHGWAFQPYLPAWQAGCYRLAERLAAPFGDRIITVSYHDRDLALRGRVADAAKLVTVHNGIPDGREIPRADPGRDPVRLISVARFEAQKDHATLFHALGGLQHLTWHLDLVGDGPLARASERLAATLGIAHRITFWGARRDVAERVAAAQVFLLSSNFEGFPLSVLEGMRAGLPVVASDVGGTSESVVEGETGFLVARGDVAGFRERLGTVIADADLRRRLGARGRRRFEQEFTLERCFTNTFAVYQDVLHARPHAAQVRLAEEPVEAGRPR
jgi:glycosyltransferase involved in cell wall biosynthesis